MTRRPVAISQADINRVVKAARKANARAIEVDITATSAKLTIMLDGEAAGMIERPKAAKRPRSLLG